MSICIKGRRGAHLQKMLYRVDYESANIHGHNHSVQLHNQICVEIVDLRYILNSYLVTGNFESINNNDGNVFFDTGVIPKCDIAGHSMSGNYSSERSAGLGRLTRISTIVQYSALRIGDNSLIKILILTKQRHQLPKGQAELVSICSVNRLGKFRAVQLMSKRNPFPTMLRKRNRGGFQTNGLAQIASIGLVFNLLRAMVFNTLGQRDNTSSSMSASWPSMHEVGFTLLPNRFHLTCVSTRL